MATLPRELSPQRRARQNHEPLQKAITYDMALSIPFGMGAEVSVSDLNRSGWSRSVYLYLGVFRSGRLRGGGTEHPA